MILYHRRKRMMYSLMWHYSWLLIKCCSCSQMLMQSTKQAGTLTSFAILMGSKQAILYPLQNVHAPPYCILKINMASKELQRLSSEVRFLCMIVAYFKYNIIAGIWNLYSWASQEVNKHWSSCCLGTNFSVFWWHKW